MTSCNYWVFREGRSAARGETLRAGLAAILHELRSGGPDQLDDALLRAGELETALADAGSDDAAPAALITNALAANLTGWWSSDVGLESLAGAAAVLRVPDTLNISTPEGFSYYTLHPLAYAELAQRLELASADAAVIGIRSIGATLSAVVTASLAGRGIAVQRTTVRPTGHPYGRKTEFTAEQLRWIAAQRSRDAEFLVVDEGPGLSGSSFLSVGEALLEAGVERRRIHFLCSRRPDPDGLAAPHAAQRWRGFRAHCVSEQIPRLPADAGEFCSGGQWRNWFYTGEQDWPASWTSMERVKFLSPDRRRLFKFIGYGRFGSAVGERTRLLSESGFGPKLRGISGGFAEYGFIEGRPARCGDLSRSVIERIADYCAVRAVEFRSDRMPSRLREMVEFNFGELLGGTAGRPAELESAGPAVVCDARMQPHEWMMRTDGIPVKTDGEGHGDDHFFPGPCDIAWDLAGASVEWNMDRDAIESLLRRFQLRSGDDARRRFAAYVQAYLVLRSAFCSMAAFAMRGGSEEKRLQRDAEHYRQRLMATLPKRETVAPASSLSPMVPLMDTL